MNLTIEVNSQILIKFHERSNINILKTIKYFTQKKSTNKYYMINKTKIENTSTPFLSSKSASCWQAHQKFLVVAIQNCLESV